jgi:sigma-B regulation protein RsbU (phosphoserine phosphatase)
LHDIGTAITSILDMDQLLDAVLEIVVHDLGYDRAMIMLVDEERSVLSSGRGIGGTDKMIRLVENLELPIREDGEVLSQVVMSGNPILVTDVNTAEVKMDMDIIAILKTESFLAVPLLVLGDPRKVIGIMAVDNFRSGVRLTESDESLLSTLAGQVAISIENARLVEEVAERERMKQELEIAYNIQVGLLPQSDPEIAGFEIVGKSIPAEEVGGDFYNYYHLSSRGMGDFPHDDRKLCIAIGDVSGKGISAAMIMAVTSGMIDSEAKKSSSASSLIDGVNRLLIPRAKPSRMNSALLYAILDIDEKRLSVANAGMIPPIVCRGDGSRCDYMDVRGFPLGMTTIYEYEETEVKLQSSDIVVLSSDGIVEAMNDDGEEFGFDRFQHIVYQNRELSAHSLTEKILGEVRGFVGSEESQDDVTIVILKAL